MRKITGKAEGSAGPSLRESESARANPKNHLGELCPGRCRDEEDCVAYTTQCFFFNNQTDAIRSLDACRPSSSTELACDFGAPEFLYWKGEVGPVMLLYDHPVADFEGRGGTKEIKNYITVEGSANRDRMNAFGERRQECANLNKVRATSVKQSRCMDPCSVTPTERSCLAIDDDLQIMGPELVPSEDIIPDVVLIIREIAEDRRRVIDERDRYKKTRLANVTGLGTR